MSNYKAISVVTAALRNRLANVCSAVVAGATVTTLRPDASSQSGLPAVGVNIFLYQVTPNAALRNQDLPTRRSDGTTLKHPVAAIDLHFLLSFYGQDANFESQLLLGAIVANLHAFPALSRSDIEAVFNASALGQPGGGGGATQGDQTIKEILGPNPQANFDPSGLADAVDLVRFTPTELSLEELSKLWSVFLDTPYVLSNLYHAGPVLIEDTSGTLTSAALPVMLPASVQTLGTVQPSIAQVVSDTGPGTPIVATSKLTLTGSFFAGAITTVLIDGVPALQLTLPSAPSQKSQAPQTSIANIPLPAAIRSGVHSVLVAQQLPTGLTTVAAQTINSNAAGFVLQPTISSLSVQMPDATTRNVVAVVAPPVSAHQTARLLLNLLNATAATPGAYVLETAAPQADATSFTFATKGLAGGDLPGGTYLVRVEIDGIDSPLQFTPPPQPGATATGLTGFTGPTVSLP